MALRCTVFGHDWGEPEMERERREDGDEVVVSVREVRTCGRCGADDVLGESMEVTTTRTPAEDAGASGVAGGESGGAVADEEYDPETDDGVILGEDGSEGATAPEEGTGAATAGGDDASDHERDPREWPEAPGDEAGGEAAGTGEPRPWPDPGTGAEGHDDPEADDRFEGPASREGSPTGDAAGEPAGAGTDDARVDRNDDPASDEESLTARRARPDEDAELLDERPPTGVGRSASPGRDESDGGGERVSIPDAEADDAVDDGAGADRAEGGDPDAAPEASGGTDPRREAAADPGETRSGGGAGAGPGVTDPDDAELVEETEPNEQSRATAEAPIDPAPGAKRGRDPDRVAESVDPEDVEYYCPECGFVDDKTRPTRRAGDVCPECRRSYLAERER